MSTEPTRRRPGRPRKGEEPPRKPPPPLGLKSKGGRPTSLSPQRRMLPVPARISARKLSLIEEVLASGYSPLEIMFRVMRGDTSITPLQLKAAELAAPYVHPRLAAIQVNTHLRSDAAPTINGERGIELPADPVEAARIYREFMVGKL